MARQPLPIHQPDWVPTAPVLIEGVIAIDAPADHVWAIIADHERWPEWFPVLDKVEVIGSGEGVGGGRRVTFNKMSFEEEFTAWEPGRHFAFGITKTTLPLFAAMAESVRIEPDGDDRCTVTYRQGMEPAKYRGWLAESLKKRMRSSLDQCLLALKARAEAA